METKATLQKRAADYERKKYENNHPKIFTEVDFMKGLLLAYELGALSCKRNY